MTASRWDQRFFETTRGQIVLLLRGASQTVEELAQALGLTDNAVRAHLATLERDALIERVGARRGAGKPSFLYALTASGERLFPKAYEPVLRNLLDTLIERQRPDQVEELLRAAGRRLALRSVGALGDLRARTSAATAALNDLGGLAELEETPDAYWIQGQRCPLASLIPDHPQLCQFTEALINELVGSPAREHCDQSATPRCRFTIAKST
jgi:predicted ArsR family transcriptional regulator